MQSYDYAQRTGVRPISWREFGSLVHQFAEAIAAFQPEMIVGLARAGLFPATALACMLQVEFYPARLTRRLNDQVVYAHPVWKVPISPEVAGKVTLIVDEIADTGETLALAAQQAFSLRAKQVITASLVSHTWTNPKPDIVMWTTDELALFPWDRQVLVDGRWQPHPELVDALRVQGTEPKGFNWDV